MAIRITPYPSAPSTTTPSFGAPSAPSVHDVLRYNLGLTSSTPTKSLTSTHPLEARLANWHATQDALKMEGLRRAYGIAEPIRRGMELKIAREGEWIPSMLSGGIGVHEDVLSNRDHEVDWEDVYSGNELRTIPDFHSEIEARLRMQ